MSGQTRGTGLESAKDVFAAIQQVRAGIHSATIEGAERAEMALALIAHAFSSPSSKLEGWSPNDHAAFRRQLADLGTLIRQGTRLVEGLLKMDGNVVLDYAGGGRSMAVSNSRLLGEG